MRTEFSGQITYSCDKYQEDHITWWDAVDVISASGYYPSGQWEAHHDRIEVVVAEQQKPFCFLEAGCPSRDGAESTPNDLALIGAPNEQIQADYLDEMLAAAADRPWVGGFMLWDWPSQLYDASTASSNDDYCVYGKQASAEVARHYAHTLAENSQSTTKETL